MPYVLKHNMTTPKEKTDWKFMFPLVLGTMMNPLNSTMLATALAEICTSFHEDISSGALLITPLYIAASIGQPLMGRLSDIYDPKTINILGIVLVLVGALMAMLAPGFAWIIAARVFFGLGTSAAFPSAMAIIAHRYSSQNSVIPTHILGIITVGSQVSLVLGPLLGGVLTQAFGWPGVFVINIPWALTTLYFLKNVPRVPRLRNKNVSVIKKTDAVGVLFFAAFLVLLLILLTYPVNKWILVPAVLVSFIAFLYWELRQPHPFLDLRLMWKQPSLLLVYIRTLCTNYILYLVLYSIPQWVEAVQDMTPSQTGLIMLPLSLMSAIAALWVGRIKKLSALNISGVITISIASASLFLLDVHAPVILILLVALLSGLSIGINIMANQTSLSAEAPPDQTGVSFGLYRTFGYLGAIVSGMQMKSFFKGGVTDERFHLCAWYAVFSCVLLVILTLVKPARKRKHVGV